MDRIIKWKLFVCSNQAILRNIIDKNLNRYCMMVLTKVLQLALV